MTDLIEKHLRFLRSKSFSDHTIADRRRLLQRLDHHLPRGLDDANYDELEATLDLLAQGDGRRRRWCAQTIATYQSHLHGYYRWAVRRGDLDWDPSADLERPRVPAGVPHPVTDEELAFTLAHAGEPYLTAILLAAYEGLRAGECAAADREDVNERTLLVPNGKGGKAAALPTHPRVWEHVRYLPDGPLIVTRHGARFGADKLSQYTSRHLTEIGLRPEITLHWYRHWFGTTVQEMQGDLRVTQELMRHSSPATTAIYTQVAGHQRRNAVQALPDLMDGRRRQPQPTPPAQTTSPQEAAA